MRDEHPNQMELGGLPPGGPAPAAELAQSATDLARVSAEVLEKGLIRESRPVFVYDKKEAEARSGNARRQERHREKLRAAGLVPARVPAELAERVRAAGGDWSAVVAPAEPPPPQFVERVVEVPVERLVERVVEVPAQLTDEQQRLLLLARRVQALRGWRRLLVGWLTS